MNEISRSPHLEPWKRADLLFLKDALQRGMSLVAKPWTAYAPIETPYIQGGPFLA